MNNMKNAMSLTSQAVATTLKLQVYQKHLSVHADCADGPSH
jgi:hypothetical protein